MARKRRYRYRRQTPTPRQVDGRPSNDGLLVEVLAGVVIAVFRIVAGLFNFVRYVCTQTNVRSPLAVKPPPHNPHVGTAAVRPLIVPAISQSPPRLNPHRGNAAVRPLITPVRSQTSPPITVPETPCITPPVQQNMPYRRAPHLLTKGERAFWHPLFLAVRGKYRIFCKVRLADIVSAPAFRRDEHRWFKKIGSYHVDFVICEPKTTAPLLVIELDDCSHTSPKQRERDEFKRAALAAASVPLLRIAAQQAYDPTELADKIGLSIIGVCGRQSKDGPQPG